MALLEVEDLRVSFTTDDGVVQAVRGVSFRLDRGESLGLVGESGSGKSVTAQTLVGLTRGAEVSGRVDFDGLGVLNATAPELQAMRGPGIGMIFQDPLTSLHPAYTVGWQIEEVIRAHEAVSRRAARERAVEMLRLVGIPHPAERVRDYPHHFSGGMRQRVMIAMAMALNPLLLIADEPTTALDVTVQAQVLQVMRRVQDEFGTAILLITHDLGVVAEMTDRVAVMYAGQVVEQADRRSIFYQSHHPYTEGLFDSLPSHRGRRLTPIPGTPPSSIRLPPGCPFHPRCPYAFETCRTDPPELTPIPHHPDHLSSCWLPHDAGDRQQRRREMLAARS